MSTFTLVYDELAAERANYEACYTRLGQAEADYYVAYYIEKNGGSSDEAADLTTRMLSVLETRRHALLKSRDRLIDRVEERRKALVNNAELVEGWT